MLWVIVAPIVFGLLAFVIPTQRKGYHEAVGVAGTLAVLLAVIQLFLRQEGALLVSWFSVEGFEVNLDLRLYAFSRFILIAAAGFAFLISIYSLKPMAEHPRRNEYYAYLLAALGATNGAVLANNFVLMLVFWESLLVLTYLFVTLGKGDATKTAQKTLIMIGIPDFILILGITILFTLTGTLTMNDPRLPVVTTGLAGLAFVLMMIGASAKAGAMPFHTWIPDAAIDAPLPFMAFLPAALEKLLGIYLLGRIGLDFFKLDRTMSIVTMSLGAVTILLPVFAALVQKDYKKLLSFHAISQVGYMVLGIGTNVALGVAGGIWHMLNHSMYKSTLFLTGGAVERQAGTTDLQKLGGLGKAMPLTAVCAFVAAASISGVPPFNGYFSKEFIYHGAKETGLWIFVICAMLGSTLTLLSFLKLTFSTYMGEKKQEFAGVKEAHWTMVVPMLIIAAGCILFGVYNQLPIKLFIQPLIAGMPVAEVAEGAEAGPINLVHHAWAITPVTIMAMCFLVLAVVIFFVGKARTRQAVKAVDFIHYAPVMRNLYDWSERRYFDIYHQGVRFLTWLAGIVFRYIERVVDAIWESIPRIGIAIGQQLRKAHTGLFAMYLSWLVTGLFFLLLFAGGIFK